MLRGSPRPFSALPCRTIGIAALVCLLPSQAARAELPGEVTDLAWCPATKDCLNWNATPHATTYDVYRGGPAGLPALLDGSTDSCVVGSFGTTSTGSNLTRQPLPGALDWYLVTARNAEGQGGAGDATSGPRSLDSAGTCVATADLVINEIDYDQPGSDQGEFVEIHNGLPHDRSLAGLVLILVNGDSGEEYRRYDLEDAGPSLPAGAYLVIGSPNVLAALPPDTLSIAFGSSSNNVQNGSPDGLALFDTEAILLLDALSYEGSITDAQFADQPATYNLVEGTALAAQDSNANDGSLCRVPDGSDTDDANHDWQFATPPSPGIPNPAG